MADSDPIRVALVAACPFPTSQGSQVFIDQLARAIAAAGHDVHLVTYGFGEYDPPPDAPWRLHRIPPLVPGRRLRAGPSMAKPLLDGLLAAKLAGVCLRYRIDLIHAVNYEAALVGYAVRGLVRRPVVYHSHGVLEQELPIYFRSGIARRIARVAGRWIERAVLGGANGVITLCEHDARRARARVRPGVPVQRINPGAGADVRRASNSDETTPADEPVFAYTGNLDRYQGLGLVLDAFARVLTEFPKARLVFGTASDPAPLLSEARRLGIDRQVAVLVGADLAGTIPLLHSACAALVPRTVPYGFPIKLLNYTAMGVPVLICDNAYDGFVDGENALIRAPDPAEYARAMIRLARDPALRRRLADGAARLSDDRYSWDVAARRIGALYSTLLRRPVEAATPAVVSSSRVRSAGP